jgi:hypothetical protein
MGAHETILNVMWVSDTSGMASGLTLYIAFLGTDVSRVSCNERLSRVKLSISEWGNVVFTKF